MARQSLFLTSIIFLLLGCAEIVPLTGGPEDETAPRVAKQEPEQGSVNYRGNEIVVEFDEYVKLNDPNSTITINPATVKVKTELEKRTLRLFWENELQENTTYIIQLNGTIRDINEANDSIMQFVFSTGPVIDSLTIRGKVAGAFSNEAMNQVTIGLYTPDSNVLKTKPVYATRSNAKGDFVFSYLKPGNYQLFAFTDINKDQKPQPDEGAGFADNTISAGDTAINEIRVFKRAADKKILRAELQAPGAALVYNMDSLDISKLTVNGAQPEILEKFSEDSLLIALPEGIATNFNFVYDSTRISKPLTAAERSKGFTIRYTGTTDWKAGDSLRFSIPDKIKGLDTTRIILQTTKGEDISYHFLRPGGNRLILVPDAGTTESFTVRFEKGAISGQTSVNDTTLFNYSVLLKADLSNLKINCKGFDGQWIFELTQNDKVLYSQIKQSGDSIIEFKQLVPGNYNLRCTEDKNRNGKWDSGNIENKIQPEIIKRFTLKQKLRPNWDIEETITMEE